MTSIESLIDDLSTDLAPVQRRSVRREVGALLAVGALELALIVTCDVMRRDLGRTIFSAYMAWKIGSLALLALVSCAVALRSFTPPASTRIGLMLTLSLAAFAMVSGTFVTSAAEKQPACDRAPGADPRAAMRRRDHPAVRADPRFAGWLMRRAAPVRPEQSAWATGLAAAICSALIFTALACFDGS